MNAATAPEIRAFFDDATNTISYLIWDPDTKNGAVIDPVLDFDHRNGTASTKSCDAILDAARDEGVTLEWVLETHAHADHLSGAPYLKITTGAKVGIGEHIRDVQLIFRPIFNLDDVSGDGSEFDQLFAEGESFTIGNLQASVIHTPGHTPACICYLIGDACFVGDTIFMPDFGTARADFPGGDAHELYQSIQKVLSLPPETRLFMCHDYMAPGRDEYAWETTVAEERERNVHLQQCPDEDAFVEMRNARDANLATPLLLLPSIQVNIRAGQMPEAEDNGVTYLKIPVNVG